MADTAALSIIKQAAAMRLAYPQATALEVLDLVMEGHHGADPNFEATDPALPFGDWTDPSSPFGELLRCAFAADEVPDEAAQLWVSEDSADDAAATALTVLWQAKVMDRFAARYRLWGA